MPSKLLQDAVNNRKVLAFNYDGKARLVEPHAVGMNRKNDLVVRAFQVAGDSASGSSWKLFNVAKMEDLSIVDMATHAPRPGYKTGDSAMVTILAELPEVMAEAA